MNNIQRIKGLREDYNKVFSSEEGKRVLKDLMKVCSADAITFDKDALTMAFNEGNRAVYLHIKTIMEMDIEKLEQMNQEQ